MSVGRVVRELRQDRGLTQEELEACTNGAVSRSYVSKLELDDIAMPTHDKLEALASALHTTTQYILEKAGFVNPVDKALEHEIGTVRAGYPEFEIMFEIARRVSPEGRRRLLTYFRVLAVEEDLQDLPEGARL